MIEGITEQKEEIAEEVEIEFATIMDISANGVTLKLDGEEESREKAYQCNAGVKFAVGDRVKIHKTSGTYVAEYPVGAPNTAVPDISELKNGAYRVSLTEHGALLPPVNSGADIGNASNGFRNLYTTGITRLGDSKSNSKIGFFGTNPISQKKVSSTATVYELITALKAYGLIG